MCRWFGELRIWWACNGGEPGRRNVHQWGMELGGSNHRPPGCDLGPCYSSSTGFPHDKRVCAARRILHFGPGMRGYAAIVGVFRQKRGFLPDRATSGSNGESGEWKPLTRDTTVWVRLGRLAAFFSLRPPDRRIDDLAL